MVAVIRNKALETFLGPLADILAGEDVAEVSINEPGELFIEEKGVMRKETIARLDVRWLRTLAELIAQENHQIVSERNPLLSARLPTGERVQVVFPPACEAHTVVYSIRKPTVAELTLEDYEESGAFDKTVVSNRRVLTDTDIELRALLKEGRTKEFCRLAVTGKKNIVVSGGTSTGKTTFLNALMREIPDRERLITLEDTREVKVTQPNKVHLIASRGDQGVAQVTQEDLMMACLRLRPNRIMLGELRGSEAFAFLRAINSGHPGSITSLHANTPEDAYQQLMLMVLQKTQTLTQEQVINYAKSVIDVVIQLDKDDESGLRYISSIQYRHAEE